MTKLSLYTCVRSALSLTARDTAVLLNATKHHSTVKLSIGRYCLDTPAVLSVFRNGLPLCTSLTRVHLQRTRLGNEELELLALQNTYITILDLH
jgi:hypothetical protein